MSWTKKIFTTVLFVSMASCVIYYTYTDVRAALSDVKALRNLHLKSWQHHLKQTPNTSSPASVSSSPSPEDPVKESVAMPLRGPGDSHLPFQNSYAAQLKTATKDVYEEKPRNKDLQSNHSSLKKILFWNDAYGAKHFGIGFGQQPFLQARCPVNTCMTTGDRQRFASHEIDAVVWHFRAKDKTLPVKRSPHTRYVFWLMESASHLYGDVRSYKDVFNWTFTYRRDSDFPNSYDNVYRLRSPITLPDFSNITAGKTKLAAWFVSNCHATSNRDDFVNAMKQTAKIDIYGGCGPLKCNINQQWDVCYKMVERDYKFYLSFENSFCHDYITEKFFNVLRFNVIPVVFGLGNYSAVAPPHSYINALDFPSAHELVKYLLYLDKNHTAYQEYFQWKAYHGFPKNYDRRMKHWCDLCERLHNDHEKKTYDLYKWFVTGSHCQNSFQSARNFITSRP